MGDTWSARKADLLCCWQDRGWPWWFAPAIAPTSGAAGLLRLLATPRATIDLFLAHVGTNPGCIPRQ